MCGILFTVQEPSSVGRKSVDDFLSSCIKCRGPDSIQTYRTLIDGQRELTFTSSVLHLRGSEVVPQPVIGDNGNVLCWNGEAWSGLSINLRQSDTQALFCALEEAGDAVHKVFEKIRGPYAFVYYQASAQRLWYGRDILGRRSLLSRTDDHSLTLCSVGRRCESDWQEVSTDGIFCHSFVTGQQNLLPWSTDSSSSNGMIRSYPAVNTQVPPETFDTKDRSQEVYVNAIGTLKQELLDAVRVRAVTIPDIAVPSPTARIAVMYSGGVDCAVLARLLHDVLPLSASVDLLNVSFENPRTLANARKLDPELKSAYDTPDRLTGLQGYHELCRTCPDRDWRFVQIDVPYAEALAAKETVLDLMFPNDSIMDYSIALAFYFCARGYGTLLSGRKAQEEYRCTAKVYFSGLGADEHLGGYSRHAAAHKSGSWPRLIAELQHDLDRIPSRNLGRDDRILSHFAREVRWPFLDESVVSYLCSLRVDCKMTFDVPGGDKVILRDLARQLGIPLAAGEKKRAVQFGSRSARMEIEHEKSDRVKGHQKQH